MTRSGSGDGPDERTQRVRGPRDEPTALLQPGDHVDNFRIQRLLGRGGMGEVYAARDQALGRRVALKFIRLAQGHDTSLEAIATARLNHPHIVTIHGVGRHRELVYLVLEYVEGQSLRERLREGTPPLPEVLHMGRAMAEAVAAAHGAGVIHRDLKPENVLCGKDGRLRIVDFGVADLVRSPEGAATGDTLGASLGPEGDARTLRDAGGQSETLTGTPAYMAPEQWHGHHGPPADVWALGVVLFELLAGHRPYAERQPVLLFEAVTSRAPVDLAPLEQVPAPVRELVGACLNKDPARRPAAAQVARRLEELAGTAVDDEETGESPFRGLLPFSERHAAAFHGRGAETDALVEQLREHPLLGVVGPTGAGKSSLVHAGVLPRMRGGGNWTCLTVRPGADPFRALAARLAAGDDDEDLARQLRRRPGLLGMKLREAGERAATRVLLVVDQLEEVVTLGAPEAARRDFLAALGMAADDAAEPVRVLFTLRDDFLGRLAQGGAPRELFRTLVVLRPPDEATLRETLTRPLAVRGWRLEDETLADDMVAEVRGEAAALPMLQVAAQVLWERRDTTGHQLTRKAYDDMGGVAGALATHADGVLGAMGPEMVAVARTLLVRLVTPEGTRQVLPRERALGGLGAEAAEALERLVTARLVTVRRGEGGEAGEAVELAHESLITRWRQLARWVDESRAVREELAEAGRAAARWNARGKRPEDLWPGPRAAPARALLRRPDVHVDGLVHAFVDASNAAQERSQRERRMLRRLLAGTAAVLTVSAVVVALWMTGKEREASRARALAEQQRADAQREGARAAWLTGEVAQARAKLRTSLETRDSMDARALWWTLSREPLVARAAAGSTVYDAAFAPDGRTVAVATQAGTILLLDRMGRTTGTLRGAGDQLLVSAFSADGRTLYVGGWDGEVRAWDLPTRTSRALGRLRDAVLDLAVHGTDVWAAGLDGTVLAWHRGGTGTEVIEARGGRSVALSPDGTRVAVGLGDGRLRLLAADDGRLLGEARGHTATVRAVRFSTDGTRLCTGSADETAALWNASDLTPGPVLRGHRGDVAAVTFTAGDQRVLAATTGGTVSAWDARTGALLGLLDGSAKLTDLEWHAATDTLVVTDGNGGVRWLDLSLPFPVPWRAGQRGPVYGVDFATGGRLLAAGGQAPSRTVLLWDAADGRVVSRLEDAEVAGSVRAVRFSPDGTRVAAAGSDPVVSVWNVPSGPVVRRLRAHSREVRDLAWTPDGTALASASLDGTVRLHDVERGAELWAGRGGMFRRVAISPDGAVVAASSDDHTITLWRRADGRELRKLRGHAALVDGIGFSPDGKRLVSGGADGELWTWSVNTGEGQRVGRGDGRLYSAFFHADGRRVLTAGSAGVLETWDPADGTRRTVGAYLTEVNRAVPSADRMRVAVGTDDDTVGLWDPEARAPRWRTAGLLPAPARALTQRGWTTTDGRAVNQPGFPADALRVAAAADTRCALLAGHHLVLAGPAGTLLEAPGVEADALWVAAGACVVRHGARVAAWTPGRGERVLADDAVAAAVGGDAVLVATATRLVRSGVDGEVLETAESPALVSAVAQHGSRWIVGERDGTVELPGARALERAHGRQVTVLAGEGDLVAGGYVDGTVALWHAPTGRLLATERVHGTVSHLLFDGGALHAASSAGDLAVLPTRILTAEHCPLLAEVAARVPVGWDDGRLVDLPAPPPCAP